MSERDEDNPEVSSVVEEVGDEEIDHEHAAMEDDDNQY
eukprot:CAMPEP_0175160058 /NCGR_PEP_ID=MMETSP0087-20121206/23789_1 /TAXON_ID=136419 /ORGANISM="Unknown Unknown, Strain D1" /LENGTH=37 /DNA_ID= /DNA_START= /DNA_END= /DNA_ORIENTATION=